MKNLRLITLFLALVLLFTVFVGCGGKSKGSANTTTTTTTTKGEGDPDPNIKPDDSQLSYNDVHSTYTELLFEAGCSVRKCNKAGNPLSVMVQEETFFAETEESYSFNYVYDENGKLDSVNLTTYGSVKLPVTSCKVVYDGDKTATANIGYPELNLQLVKFYFDDNGHLYKEENYQNFDDVVCTRSYDDKGRLVKSEYDYFEGEEEVTFEYKYNGDALTFGCSYPDMDVSGYTATLQDGRIISVGFNEEKVEFSYDDKGNCTQCLITENGEATSKMTAEYDENGNLKSFTEYSIDRYSDEETGETSEPKLTARDKNIYEYDTAGKCIEVSFWRFNAEENKFAEYDRVEIKYSDKGTISQILVYDGDFETGELFVVEKTEYTISEANRMELVLSYVKDYDSWEDEYSDEFVLDSKQEYEYDDMGRILLKAIYSRQNDWWEGEYSDDLVLQEKEEYEYDETGNLTMNRVHTSNGYYELCYNEKGLGYKFTISQNGEIVSETTTEFNDQDLPVRTTEKDGSGNIIQIGEYEYNAQSKVVRYVVKDKDGNITLEETTEYDENGNVVKEQTITSGVKTAERICQYHENGELSFESIYEVVDLGYYRYVIFEENTYDVNGNLIMQVSKDENGNLTSETLYTYSDDGELKTEKETEYGENGNIVEETYYEYYEDYDEFFDEYIYYSNVRYDESGKKIYERIRDNRDPDRIREYEFDINEGSSEEIYDSEWNLIFEKETDAEGNIIELYQCEYDENGVLIRKSNEIVGEFKWIAEYREGKMIKYTRYDENGEFEYEQEYQYADDGKTEIVFTKDEIGNIHTISESKYDEQGRNYSCMEYDGLMNLQWGWYVEEYHENDMPAKELQYYPGGTYEILYDEYGDVIYENFTPNAA